MKKRIIPNSHNSIVAAEGDNKPNAALEDALANLEADFDYIMSGLEKLGRSGVNTSNDALAIVENLSNDLKNYTAQIADRIAE